MRMNVIGFEILTGTSSKTGKPYDMSRLHTCIPLSTSETAKGASGTTYDCPSEVLEKIKHLTPPLICDVEMHDVMRYGRRVQEISSVVPVERAKAAA